MVLVFSEFRALFRRIVVLKSAASARRVLPPATHEHGRWCPIVEGRCSLTAGNKRSCGSVVVYSEVF